MIYDRLKNSRLQGAKLPKFHGHTKITLHDVITGKDEIREKDNLVTDAVLRIFAANYLGVIDYNDLTPVRDLFGGVLAFAQPLNTTEIMPPDPLVNAMVGNAGQQSHASASTTRGNPNGGESGETANGYKFVWDFATNQANGTISALALTHKNAGDVGLVPNPVVPDTPLILPTSNQTVILKTGNGNNYTDFGTYLHGLICLTEGGTVGYTFDYTTGELNKVKVYYYEQGVNNVLADAEIIETREPSGMAFTMYGSVTWEPSTGLFYFVDFPTTSQCVVGCYNWASDTLETKTFAGTFARTTPPTDGGARQACYINKFVKSGDFFYVYNAGYVVRLDWENPNDVVICDGFVENDITSMGQVPISEGIVLTANSIITGTSVYPVATYPVADLDALLRTGAVSNANVRVFRFALTDDPHCAVLWEWTRPNVSSNTINLHAGVGFALPYLATIQNLDDPVTKNSTQTMKIEYTITEE